MWAGAVFAYRLIGALILLALVGHAVFRFVRHVAA